MRWTNLAIIFSLFLFLTVIAQDIRLNNLSAINNKEREYTIYLDNAVDDGTQNLVELDVNKKNLVLMKEKAVDQFYTSLYANFGILGDKKKEELLSRYIPIILITDEEGFYINYTDIYQKDNESIYVKRWTEKFPYTLEDRNLIYHFSINDKEALTIYDENTQEILKGSRKDLKEIYPESEILTDSEVFDTYRRNTIIKLVEEKMNYYINQYNDIAYQFGITYQFWLPQVDETDWYRTIDNISMFVVFQGYPYQVGSLDTYNRYAFGGARINKSRTYFITEKDGMKYYHKANCSNTGGRTGAVYYTPEDCAKEGAFPDPDCNP